MYSKHSDDFYLPSWSVSKKIKELLLFYIMFQSKKAIP
jgi:hypothetical protein